MPDRPEAVSAPLVGPIFQSTTFLLTEASYDDITETGGLREAWYTRFGNPTVAKAASEIAALELAEAGTMTSSGMAGIAVALVTLCRAGDRIVASEQVYGDTHDLLKRDLPRLGVETHFVDGTDSAAWEEAITRWAPSVVFAETLSNPRLELLDLPAVVGLARRVGARVVVDNTFASAYILQPLSFGADIVVNSVTKLLNGHSDVVAGCVVGSASLIDEIRSRVVTFGCCLDPHAAFLVSRGLRTFPIRAERQMDSAASLARHLDANEEVEAVIHPSLPSYEYHDLASRLMPAGRFGTIVTFVVRGGDQRAQKLMHELVVAKEATSLGGVETLISMPITSSHFMLTADELATVRIEPGMIRLSVGLEPVDALANDLDRALKLTAVSQPVVS